MADFVAVRVVAVRAGLLGPEDWLILRRNVLTEALKTYLSNAPADTPVAHAGPAQRHAVADPDLFRGGQTRPGDG